MGDAFVFPGQGSQAVGMGQALAEAYGDARAVFEEVDEALGEKLSAIIWEGPGDALTLTRNAQPALMAVSIAALRALQSETGGDPVKHAVCVAGHSLGEYSALAAAGSLSVADAARLLRVRGEAMQTAVPVGEGAMAALIGLEIDTAREVVEEASSLGACDCANDNAPGQVVVSGARAAVERATEIASDKGARRAVMLPVSAPFHCRLMAPAAERMRDALAETALGAPAVPVFQNVAASPESDPDIIRANLIEQVTATVRWRESVAAMREAGVTRFFETGAGKVLAGLIKRIDRSAGTLPLGEPDDIIAAKSALSI